MTLSTLHLSSLSSSLIHLFPPSKFDHFIFTTPLSMASSNSLRPLHHHSRHHAAGTTTTSRRRRHSLDSSSTPTPFPSSLFLKPTKPTTSLPSKFSTTTSAAATAAATTNLPTTFDLLRQHLSAQNFREADEETRRLLIQLAGDAAQKRGYVFFSEVKFISKQDLQEIDSLWRQHSNNKYGYSVQRKIWNKLDKDFTKFFIKIGWMKRLENSEIEQYNYKAFPDEFFWEMTEETPEGHLPLTNALRGTQLLTSILSHPAFEETEEQEEKDGGFKGNFSNDVKKSEKEEVKQKVKSPLSKLFKPDYSF